MNIRGAYQLSIEQQGHTRDSAQELVVDRLADLQADIAAFSSPWQKLARMLRIGSGAAVRGIYLWGDVGRGKTCPGHHLGRRLGALGDAGACH